MTLQKITHCSCVTVHFYPFLGGSLEWKIELSQCLYTHLRYQNEALPVKIQYNEYGLELLKLNSDRANIQNDLETYITQILVLTKKCPK